MNDPTLIHYILAIIAGAVAGYINTLAGSGSLITLPMLIFLGLGADVANGTNRIGVLLAAIVGTDTFRRRGALDLKCKSWLLWPVVIGAIGGAGIATVLSAKAMHAAIAVVMVLMLFVILAKPKRWLREDLVGDTNHKRPSTVLIFLTIGIYAGFIQAGAGVFMLAALVLHERYSLTQANAIKLLMVLLLSIPALVVFVIGGDVHWWLGLLMAVGQIVGAFFAARFATSHPKAKEWTHRLLIVIVVLSILKLTGALDWLIG